MSDILSPSKLLKKYHIKAKKSLGQNFLKSFSMAQKIVDIVSIPPESIVVELGSGLGILTYALAQKASKVWAYEIDQRLLKILKEESFLPPHVEIRKADILKINYLDLAQEAGSPLILFGNLPYYLSSRLVYKLLKQRQALNFAVFMFQKEVAQRFLSLPGSKLYGHLTVLLRSLARVEKLLTLSSGNFFPPPEVDSTLLKISFQKEKLFHEELFLKVVKIAFAHRRKTLAFNLKNLGLKTDQIQELLGSLGLPPKVRAEELSEKEFQKLAFLLASKVE